MSPPRAASRRRRRPGRPSGGEAGEAQEALLEAARALMAEKGLPRVTAREVATRAGVVPALVNYHFGGKDGLLRAVVEHVAASTLASATEGLAAGGGAEERLRAMLRQVIAAMAEDPYGPRLIMEQVLFGDEEIIDEFAERFAKRNLQLFQELLDQGRSEGVLRSVEPMFLMPMLMGSSVFFFLALPVLRRLFGIEEITPELAGRFADQLVDVILHGISARPEEPR